MLYTWLILLVLQEAEQQMFTHPSANAPEDADAHAQRRQQPVNNGRAVM
jgi:hypothetical protein